MIMLVGLVAGLALALGLVRFAGRQGPRRARCLYAVGLVVAALIYLGFAAAGRASAALLATEALGVAVYGTAAVLGFRRWPSVLALGWATHVMWDTPLHVEGAAAVYTPDWYPWLCVSFDLVLAGAVWVQRREQLGRRHG
jgi:hypothetical protein